MKSKINAPHNVTPVTGKKFYSTAANFTVVNAESFTELPAQPGDDKSDSEYLLPIKLVHPSPDVVSFVNYSAPDVRANDENVLVLSAWPKSSDDHTILTTGDSYVIRTTGTYQKTRNNADVRISNCRLEIVQFENHYEFTDKDTSNPVRKQLIHGNAKLGNGRIYPWCIELSKYKNLFSDLAKAHGDITFSVKASDGIDNYLSDLYADALDKGVPVTISIQWSGWFELDNQPARYYIGTMKPGASLLNIEKSQRFQTVCNGLRYLEIGRHNKEICVLFLYMHAGFSNFWFKKAGLGWNMGLVVQGETNAGKTSILEISTDILDPNPKSGLIELGHSTEAGARRVLDSVYRDTFCCYDDYANADESTARNAHTLIESALRLIGDGAGRVKAGSGSSVVREQAHCVLAVTAEEGFRLKASSHSRYLQIILQRAARSPENGAEISPGSFDLSLLAFFREHPEFLHAYFSLFISFLTEKGYEIVDYIRNKTPSYRSTYSRFEIGRLIDATVRLKLQAEIIGEFLTWCGLPSDKASSITYTLENAIEPTILDQKKLFFESTPAQVFMNAIINCFDFNKQLAPDENTYLYSSGAYIGFRDDDEGTFWLDKNIVNTTVSRYFVNEGIDFRVAMGKVSELLCKAGYAKAIVTTKKDGSKHYSYLPRSRKGTSQQRHGMYVLYVNKLTEFYNGED